MRGQIEIPRRVRTRSYRRATRSGTLGVIRPLVGGDADDAFHRVGIVQHTRRGDEDDDAKLRNRWRVILDVHVVERAVTDAATPSSRNFAHVFVLCLAVVEVERQQRPRLCVFVPKIFPDGTRGTSLINSHEKPKLSLFSRTLCCVKCRSTRLSISITSFDALRVLPGANDKVMVVSRQLVSDDILNTPRKSSLPAVLPRAMGATGRLSLRTSWWILFRSLGNAGRPTARQNYKNCSLICFLFSTSEGASASAG